MNILTDEYLSDIAQNHIQYKYVLILQLSENTLDLNSQRKGKEISKKQHFSILNYPCRFYNRVFNGYSSPSHEYPFKGVPEAPDALTITEQ